MLLLLSIKEVVRLQSRLIDFVSKISSFKTSMLQFLRKTKFSNLPLEFCKSMDYGARAKKHLLVASYRHLVGTGFSRRCLGMFPKLAIPQLPTVPRLCFSKMAAKDHRSGQSSSVQLYKEALDEARGQPVLPCLSRRLCYLISKSIACMIDLKIKQIRK